MNHYRSPLVSGHRFEAPPDQAPAELTERELFIWTLGRNSAAVWTSVAWDSALTSAVMEHAAGICEVQAARFTDDRARYVAMECAMAIRQDGKTVRQPVHEAQDAWAPGLRTLQNVIECLRADARYVDEEGEATDRLQGLLDALRHPA